MTVLEAAKSQHEIIYVLLAILSKTGVKLSDELPTLLPEILLAKSIIDAAQERVS